MKVVVTGAGGQLGQAVVAQLKDDGQTVVSLKRHDADLTNEEQTAELLKKAAPDALVNCAAYTDVDKAESEPQTAYAVNRDGATNLAAIANDLNARLIHISTDFVFDGTNSKPYTEDDTPHPINLYGESKLAGEQEVLQKCPQALVVRTSWLFSHVGHNFVKTILKLAAEKETLKVVDDQIGTPTYTVDLAQAISDILDKTGLNGIIHLANEGVASWYDLAFGVLDEVNREGLPCKTRTLTPIPTEDWPTPAGRPPYSVLSKCKARQYLATPMPHWRQGLTAAIEKLINSSKT